MGATFSKTAGQAKKSDSQINIGKESPFQQRKSKRVPFYVIYFAVLIYIKIK
jgi:hypothetical protein